LNIKLLIATNTSVYIANHTPISHRGRFNSVFPIIRKIGFALGPWLTGMFINNSNVRSVWLIILFLSGCSNIFNKSSADWAFSFDVWNGYIYQFSDEYVDDIGDEIGEVTKHSDTKGTYSGNFSNLYEKGTKYFAIQGISTEEAIAIEEEYGKYRKAIRDGKFGEN